ncbi:26232_t:CDS:2 [Gigaspora rosea]|nr:26232_t:CDS:2 [Gigaspora rosea]
MALIREHNKKDAFRFSVPGYVDHAVESEYQTKDLLETEESKHRASNFSETEELEHQTNNLLEEFGCQVNNSFKTEGLEHRLNKSLTIEESEQQADNLFINFLEDIKEDYKKQDPQLCAALDKFSARYKATKLQSISRLTTFLYDINCNSDPLMRVKGSKKISIQVESIKQRKTGNKC